MTTTFLFEMSERMTNTLRIVQLMKDGQWRHRAQIEREASLQCAPQTTMRLLRKIRKRGFVLEKKTDPETPGMWWYRARKVEGVPQITEPEKRVKALTKEQKRAAYVALTAVYENNVNRDLWPLIDWLGNAYK